MSDITSWNTEDHGFWEKTGRAIANRNLIISIIALMLAFCVWGFWGIITVQLSNINYGFSTEQLFSLMAIAGLSGATLRIPSTFMIRIAGGRNTVFFTTLLLLIPAVGTGLALLRTDTPLWVFQLFAFLSGIGGGNFSSSMSNISFFYPKKVQGLSLGLNAGIGNAGVTLYQVIIPLAVGFSMLIGGSSLLVQNSSSILGRMDAGTSIWIQNAALVWVIFLVPTVIACFFGMNNLKVPNVTPNLPSPFMAFSRILMLLFVGLLTSFIGGIMTLGLFGIPKISIWIVVPVVVLLTVLLLKVIPSSELQKNLAPQYSIFKEKHTWVLALLYTATFGSFIGFAVSFPLSIKVIFGHIHVLVNGVMTHDTLNQNGPNALTYAWIGPLLGALARPIGGFISDKIGGALVLALSLVTMLGSILAALYYLNLAYQSATPEIYFWPFFIVFVLLFTATGVGNGSVYRIGANIFDKVKAGPVLGWIASISAYGAFIIPKLLGAAIKQGSIDGVFIQLAVFYGVCLLVVIAAYMMPWAKHRGV